MELIPNSCCNLCEEKTTVLSKKAVQPFVASVGKVFFNAERKKFKEDELCLRTICCLCVQKISACERFKKSYEEVRIQNGLKKTRSCYVCKKKDLYLVSTSDNPNDIITKFKLFITYSSNDELYDNCEICLDCFFYINLWFQVHNNLVKKLNLDGQILQSFVHADNGANVSSDETVKKDKENVTPPHNNIQEHRKRRTSSVDDKLKSPIKLTIIKQSKIKKSTRKLSSFFTLLNKQLKNVKSLRDSPFGDLRLPDSVSSDEKMYSEVPYVLLAQNNLVGSSTSSMKRKLRRRKSIEVIDLTDSEEDSVSHTDRVSFALLPNTNSEVSDEIKTTCNICDKDFFRICDYKSHCLWHEKPEHCQIDLVRRQLPDYAKSSEFIGKPAGQKRPSVDDVVNKIISKYIFNNETNVPEKLEESTTVCNGNESIQEEADSTKNDDISEKINENEAVCNNESNTKSNATEEPEKQDTDAHTSNSTIEQINDNVEINGNNREESAAETDLSNEEVDKECADIDSQNDTSCSKDEVLEFNDTRKRKRSPSPQIGSSDDEAMPKIKKVRFAIDYSTSRRSEEIACDEEEEEEEETNLNAIQEEEEETNLNAIEEAPSSSEEHNESL